MSDCNPNPAGGPTISEQLLALGPRTVEGDQGRVSMHSIHDAIAAIEYERKRTLLKNKRQVSAMLRTISGHRLAAPGGVAE